MSRPSEIAPEIYRMEEVAAKLGKSRRWLQDFLRDHPCGRRAGRTRLFTPSDLAKLIDALPLEEPVPCRSRSSRRRPAARPTIGPAAHTSESEWTEALRLVSKARNARKNQKNNVVPISKFRT